MPIATLRHLPHAHPTVIFFERIPSQAHPDDLLPHFNSLE